MASWYVTANDIKNWTATNKRRAEETLPLLVKKLILASCSPKTIDFPTGDSVLISGWDGILEVEEGNEFVPEGKSGWEFGTNSNVKGKADDDYDKRLGNPEPFILDETTFVFVTSRLWSTRNSWVISKQSESKWKNIKGINAETLQNWLEQYPAVHRWFAELIGKRCADLWDIEQAWEAFSCVTAVKLKSEFFLYDREEELNTLKNALSGSPNIYRVKAKSKNEAYGFVLSSILEDDVLKTSCLVVKSQNAWDLMASSKHSLILVPLGFQPDGIGVAVSNGHKVLYVIDDKDSKDACVNLTYHQRLAREAAIIKLGFNKEKARQIYQDTKGYFEPLLRHILMEPIDYVEPSWLYNTSRDILYSIFFASEWNESNENDKQVISILSGLPYTEVEKTIIELSKVTDPPIRKIGTVWQIISKMDLWLHIAPLIAKPYMDRFSNAITGVMLDVDPSYNLPSEERYMASIKGTVPLYSSSLKHGLVDSMTIISAYGDEFARELGGERPSQTINFLVHKIFSENNTTHFWYSIRGFTNLIAEAAPNAYLDAVQSGSDGDNSPILGLFKAEGDGVFGGCYHSGLLWGLELISWNKKYLAKVSLCLARLSQIDPGGRWSNRPFNSLVHMYIGWINNISATHEERLKVLSKVLIPQYPEIAWKLMIELLINKTNHTSGICKPEYREWNCNLSRHTTNIGYLKYVEAIVDLLLHEVNISIEDRVIDLVGNFNSYNKRQQDEIIQRMLEINVDELPSESRIQIINRIRNVLSNHREFPDADWAWPSELLESLEQVYNYFSYQNLVKANSYLFDDYWPKLIRPIRRKEIPYEEREEIVRKNRIYTFEAIYREHNIEGVIELLTICKLTRLVGNAAFQSSFSEEIQELVFEWLECDGGQGEFAKGFLQELASHNLEYAEKVIKENSEWSPKKKAKFLLCMPLKESALKIVETLPEDGKIEFWTKLNYYNVSDKDQSLISYISSKLLENNRPLAAIDAIAQAFYRNKDNNKLDSNLIIAVLKRIATNPSDINTISIQHVQSDILEAIDFLYNAENVSKNDIRQIEWMYLNIFRISDISPKYLMQSIAEDPSFFAQLVIWVYKAEEEERSVVESVDQNLAKQRAEVSWDLLRTASILPGQQGNEIDERALSEWVESTRRILREADRSKIGDDQIGSYLSRCPEGKDGIWPHESVRAVIEKVRSREFDVGFECGRINSRGITSRDPYAGGVQERTLTKKYYTDAEEIQLVSPRTADILYSISRGYEWDAEREDRKVDLRGYR